MAAFDFNPFSAVAGVVTGLINGGAQAAEARRQRNAANQLRDYENQTDLQNWEFANANRAYEYNQLMRIYNRSRDVYRRNLNFNNQAAQRSYRAELNTINEEVQRLAFQRQDLFVQMLRERGTANASGRVGNTAYRNANSALASFGRDSATLTENLVSAYRQHQMNMGNIRLSQRQADLEAYSRLGLRPQRPPRAPRPRTRPSAGAGANPLLSIASSTIGAIGGAFTPRT